MAADEKVLTVLAQLARLPVSGIRTDARLGDLGLGSSIVLNILRSRLHEEFGVSPEMSWKTPVRDVVAAANAGPGASAVARPAAAARAVAPRPPAPPAALGASGAGISGIGIDLEDPAALPEMGDPFYRATFTPREMARAAESANPREHLAGIWSVKEAARKAVAALMDAPLTALEVQHDERGRPSLVVAVEGVSARLQFHISITHTKNMAAAVVVATTKSW